MLSRHPCRRLTRFRSCRWWRAYARCAATSRVPAPWDPAPRGEPAETNEPLPEDGAAPLAAELEELLEVPTETPEGPTEACGTPPAPPPVEIDGTGPTCGVCTDGTLEDVTEPDPLEPTDGGGGVLTEGVRTEGVEIGGVLLSGVGTDGTVTDGTCTD